jgi:protein involved in polysaccharide export with SLBB domain
LAKVAQPTYTIEIPDILLIDALRVVPLPPYKIEPLDTVLVHATGVVEPEPITGLYAVEPEGTINFGPTYGSVSVAGLTIQEARDAIEKHLKENFKKPEVRVAMGQPQGLQQIKGQHIVRPDGTVGLGTYGSVFVAGLTLEQAKYAIEQQLSLFLLKPKVAVDVFAYNSKAYYIIIDGGGYGEQVYRLPSTGNETVLDAISHINGLPVVSNNKRIWLARPAPADKGSYQIFPVDWRAVTRGGATATNYQVLPGDRIFVEAEPLITFDTRLARLISPIERVLGITLLGSSTVHSIAVRLGAINSTGGF